MRRSVHRLDSNHKEIVRALKAAGASVESLTTAGLGVPDLLVGFRNANYLLEVKDEKGKETVAQVEWAARWRGTRYIVRSAEEALGVIGAIKPRRTA